MPDKLEPTDNKVTNFRAGESLESRSLSEARNHPGDKEKSLNPSPLSEARDPATPAKPTSPQPQQPAPIEGGGTESPK